MKKFIVLFFCNRAQFFRSTKALKTSDKGGGGGEPGSPLSDAVGLNELEGAVLLDAEDYRRMLQEVKTLKSILLRLKRELAADVSRFTEPQTHTLYIYVHVHVYIYI